VNGDIAKFIAPFTLILGAGLFAARALSFLDIHFFKTKFGATAACLALIVLTEFIFVTSAMSARFINGQGPPGCRVFKTDFFRLHAPNYTTSLSFAPFVRKPATPGALILRN
jgi:hypothetical protein